MAVIVHTIQANEVEALATAVTAYIADETIAQEDVINVTINDVKGRPTATIVYDDGVV